MNFHNFKIILIFFTMTLLLPSCNKNKNEEKKIGDQISNKSASTEQILSNYNKYFDNQKNNINTLCDILPNDEDNIETFLEEKELSTNKLRKEIYIYRHLIVETQSDKDFVSRVSYEEEDAILLKALGKRYSKRIKLNHKGQIKYYTKILQKLEKLDRTQLDEDLNTIEVNLNKLEDQNREAKKQKILRNISCLKSIHNYRNDTLVQIVESERDFAIKYHLFFSLAHETQNNLIKYILPSFSTKTFNLSMMRLPMIIRLLSDIFDGTKQLHNDEYTKNKLHNIYEQTNKFNKQLQIWITTKNKLQTHIYNRNDQESLSKRMAQNDYEKKYKKLVSMIKDSKNIEDLQETMELIDKALRSNLIEYSSLLKI